MKKIFTLLASVFAFASLSVSAANIYISNQGDFKEVALYAWSGAGIADTAIFGGWPGATASSTKTVGGATYDLFTTTATGSVNLIYNWEQSNEATKGQLKDLNVTIEDGKDYYFAAYATGLKVIENPEAGVEIPDPFTLYVDNQTGWATVNVYAWATGATELFGGWPGATSNGTETIKGVEYLTYEMPVSGTAYNFIFNSGDDKVEGLTVTPTQDIYVKLTATDATVINNPNFTYYTIYVEDKTGWDAFYIYGYNGAGAGELFGGWPGASASGTAVVDGRTFLTFPVVESETDYNLIFTNNDGTTQYDAFSIVPNRDWYIVAEATSAYEDTTAAVNEIEIENSGVTPVYFNLYGQRVNNPDNGLFIEVRGSEVRKVIL